MSEIIPFVLLLTVLASSAVVVLKLRRWTPSGTALIRSTSSGTTVHLTSVMVLPVVHRAEAIDLTLIGKIFHILCRTGSNREHLAVDLPGEQF